MNPRLPIVTILFSLLVIFVSIILIYNLTLFNPFITIFSLSWSLFVLYNTIVLFYVIDNDIILNLNKYLSIIFYFVLLVLIESTVIFCFDIVISKEIHTVIYIKYTLSLLIVTWIVSLIYFLSITFSKYRVLWMIGIVGTIVLAPLIAEAEAFVRGISRSLLDYWNIIVPYRAVEQLRQFILLEGWQGWDIALGSVLHLLLYWFIIVSFCLYVRQLQSEWRVPGPLRG